MQYLWVPLVVRVMRRWHRFVDALGATRVVGTVGVLLVSLAVVRVVRLTTGTASVVDAALGGAVVGGLGLLVVYGAYWLPDSDLHPAVYPRVATWCLGGFAAMLGVVGVLFVIVEFGRTGGSIDRPLFAVPLALGIGSVGGLAIGVNEARAVSRAREAERRNRELQRTKAELERTVRRLETSNERLEQFAYAASHDLQEPLRMVSSYLRLVEGRHAGDLDEEAEEFLGYAVDGADRMRAMIESLLEYSQVNARGKALEPVDADAVLADVLDDLSLRIEETDATVTADDLPVVRADRDQLAQVFRNLVSNALTYSGDASPRVHVGVERAGGTERVSSTGQDGTAGRVESAGQVESAGRVESAGQVESTGRVDTAESSREGGWRFAVEDEGIGIDPDYQEQVFEVFNRLHTTDEYPGTGIGLALCERIVDRHGGDIRVDSEPGEGSTFSFTLPAATDEADAAPPDESLSTT